MNRMIVMSLRPSRRAFSLWFRCLRWGASLGLSLLLCAAAQAQSGCVPVAVTPETPGKDICYGTAAWRERTLGGTWQQQRLDFYRAPGVGGGTLAPLIVWAHPNGSSKSIVPGSAADNVLLQPALAAGFSFASIEFRHPVANANEADSPTNPGVPHYDLARALQFLRANAAALGIDRRNVFVVGGSRGTLSLWTVLQNDMAIPTSPDPVARQSTRANAAFAYNAQTTYDGREFADLFLVEADRPAFKAAWQAQHPKYAQYGSSIQSASADDPPVMLRYDQPFIGRLVTQAELATVDYVHYPDYGLAMCAAYRMAGIGARCTVEAGPQFDGMAGYSGYVDFFRQHLRGREKPVLPADPAASSRSGKAQATRAGGATGSALPSRSR
jgi:acetyl esterase/lipase